MNNSKKRAYNKARVLGDLARYAECEEYCVDIHYYNPYDYGFNVVEYHENCSYGRYDNGNQWAIYGFFVGNTSDVIRFMEECDYDALHAYYLRRYREAKEDGEYFPSYEEFVELLKAE